MGTVLMHRAHTGTQCIGIIVHQALCSQNFQNSEPTPSVQKHRLPTPEAF